MAVDKTLAEIANLQSIANMVKDAHEGGFPNTVEHLLKEAEQSVKDIRGLVGGTHE